MTDAGGSIGPGAEIGLGKGLRQRADWRNNHEVEVGSTRARRSCNRAKRG